MTKDVKKPHPSSCVYISISQTPCERLYVGQQESRCCLVAHALRRKTKRKACNECFRPGAHGTMALAAPTVDPKIGAYPAILVAYDVCCMRSNMNMYHEVPVIGQKKKAS